MSSSNRKNKLLIFLSYAEDDKPTIRELYHRLKEDGFDPWLDEERLLPGQDRQLEIEQAMRNSNIILVNFSQKSLVEEGYFQVEYKRALHYQEEKPEGTIFVIPVRLDNCEVPYSVRDKQYVDYPSGYQRLLKSLKKRLDRSASVQNSPPTGRGHSKQIQIAMKDNIESGLSLGSRRRYIDALDSARFTGQTSHENVRLLNLLYAKAQLFLALATGDTIIVAENQFFDSRGFLDAFDELYQASQKLGSDIDLPIKVAIREKWKDVFDVIEYNLNNEDFVFSLWPPLNDDKRKRNQWANFIRNRQKPTDEDIPEEEKKLLTKLLIALKYFTPERTIIAETIASLFEDRIKQVIELSDDEIYDLYTGTPREDPQRKFLEEDEIFPAKEIRNALKKIQDNVGTINSRSIIRRELKILEEELQEDLKDGLIILTDAIYNQTNGIGTRATLVQSSIFSPQTHKYAKAGYSLSTFIQDTSNNKKKNLVNWEIYSLDYFEGLEGFNEGRKSEYTNMLEDTHKNTPWESLLEIQQNPEWQASLKRFQDCLTELQHIHKDLSSTLTLTRARHTNLEKERKKHERQLTRYWTQHTKNISKIVINSYWSLTEKAISFNHPGNPSFQLSYSFLTTKQYMEPESDYKFWRTIKSFKGRFDEIIKPTR